MVHLSLSIILALSLKSVLLAIGIPANLFVIFKVLGKRRRRPGQQNNNNNRNNNNNPNHNNRRLNRLEVLTTSLCFVDLLLLLSFNISMIVQVFTREFKASAAMCKLVQFFLSLVFTMVSFTLGGIAVERTCRVYARTLVSRLEGLRRAKVSITVAWALAICVNLPHVLLYSTHNFGHGGTQCISVFRAERLEDCYQRLSQYRQQVAVENYAAVEYLNLNTTAKRPFLAATADNNFSWVECVGVTNAHELSTTLFYLLLLFYLPAGMMIGCNAAIIWRIWNRGHTPLRQTNSISGRMSSTFTRSVKRRGHNPTRKQEDTGGTGGTEEPSAGSREGASLAGAAAMPRPTRTHRIRENVVVWNTVKLMLLFVLLWLPHHMMELVKLTHPTWYIRHYSYISFSMDLITVNAVINPFVYKLPSVPLYNPAVEILAAARQLQQEAAVLIGKRFKRPKIDRNVLRLDGTMYSLSSTHSL